MIGEAFSQLRWSSHIKLALCKYLSPGNYYTLPTLLVISILFIAMPLKIRMNRKPLENLFCKLHLIAVLTTWIIWRSSFHLNSSLDVWGLIRKALTSSWDFNPRPSVCQRMSSHFTSAKSQHQREAERIHSGMLICWRFAIKLLAK